MELAITGSVIMMSGMNISSAQEFTHSIERSLFEANPEAWRILVPEIRKKQMRKDEVVVRHGDLAEYLWLVYSGWVKLTRQTPDGKETITGLCTEGDVFGEAALFPNASYPYHAEIIGGSAELGFVAAKALQQVIRRDSGFSAALMSLLNDRNAQTQLRLEHVSTMSTAQRLGCFLLRLCKDNSTNATLQIPVEKHILASYLGMKPETLSRSLQQLKTVGVEGVGARITVQNVGRLRNFVCDSCSESGSCDSEPLDAE